MRLQESIAVACQGLAVPPAWLASMPREAITLHRLLGRHPLSAQPKASRYHPLPLDVLVVDEGSMVDLELFVQLLAVLPESCRLIILGDAQQLAAVQAGEVFSSLCHPTTQGFSPAVAQQFEGLGLLSPSQDKAQVQTHPLQDNVTWLWRSYRFSQGGGVARLANQLSQQHSADQLTELWTEHDELSWCEHALHSFETTVLSQAEACWSGLLSGLDDPKSALARFNQSRILTVQRKGRFGAEAINALLATHFAPPTLSASHYPGRPIQILENDYGLQLFNGDVGIILPQGGGLFAYFLGTDGEGRWLPLARLPRHETAYAMTVHKSQGSEFDQVILVLPDQAKPWLSRELFYTGITRAKHRLFVWGDYALLPGILQRHQARYSRLADYLA